MRKYPFCSRQNAKSWLIKKIFERPSTWPDRAHGQMGRKIGLKKKRTSNLTCCWEWPILTKLLTFGKLIIMHIIQLFLY